MRKFLMLGILAFVGLVLAACQETDEGSLVVGLECDYAPFNWTTNDATAEAISGTPFYCDGYDVEIARIIAEELGLELVIRQVSWEGLIPALTSGQIDVIIAGMSPTPERAQTVNFTNPYFVSEQVLVVRNDSVYASASSLDDFDGARVVAQLGTLQDDLITQISNVVHRTPLENYASLVNEVVSGASDALVAEYPVAQSIVASNANITMVVLGENGFTVAESDVSVSVALRLSDTDLRDQINAVLAGISDERRNALMQEAQERQGS